MSMILVDIRRWRLSPLIELPLETVEELFGFHHDVCSAPVIHMWVGVLCSLNLVRKYCTYVWNWNSSWTERTSDVIDKSSTEAKGLGFS